MKIGVSHGGRSKGWAYVAFATHDVAMAALTALEQTLSYEGRKLHVALALDKRDILFPSLTRDQRQRLKLDSVALFSTAGMLARVARAVCISYV